MSSHGARPVHQTTKPSSQNPYSSSDDDLIQEIFAAQRRGALSGSLARARRGDLRRLVYEE
jgi:hypothetical protein